MTNQPIFQPKLIYYALKILDPKKKSDFMQKFLSTDKFCHPQDLRSGIQGEFRLLVPEGEQFALSYYCEDRGNDKIHLVTEEYTHAMCEHAVW